MSFTVTIDAQRWRDHQDAVAASVQRSAGAPVVPVIKGNGYGLGQTLLTSEAVRLGADTVAVGTVFEVEEVARQGTHDILVLEPYEPRDSIASDAWWGVGQALHAGRVIRTIASTSALLSLTEGTGSVRVVLEASTSMHRFGMDESELLGILADARIREALARGRILIEGLALHLPLVQPSPDHRAVPGARWKDADVAPEPPAGSSARVREALAWGLGWLTALADVTERVQAAGDPEVVTELTEAAALWVSHLDDVELASLRGALPDIALFPRIGTRLWLGDRGALVARGTVLAVHAVGKGQTSGYRQRRASREGAVVVIGGGTAHGVAMEAPSAVASMRQRVVVAGTGILDAAGRALSPFHIGGAQVWFAEPPHMQVSLVRVPRGIAVPAVGDEVDVDVRLTGIAPDRVVGLD